MVLHLLAAKFTVAKVALTVAFTLGSVAGAAAVVGVCAGRRAIARRTEGEAARSDA
mgnify:CR=1 FL=1